MSSLPILDIITHGNCPDGWGAAYLYWLAYQGDHEVRIYPVAPAQEGTWPTVAAVAGHKLFFLDVTCGSRMPAYAAVATEVRIVDHHPTAKAHAGLAACASISEDCCATRLAWNLLHPGLPEPAWVTYINQIDMWQDVTAQTLAFREIVMPIARMAVTDSAEEALAEMAHLIARMDDPEQECQIYLEGLELYKDKLEQLELLLAACPQTHSVIDEPLRARWNLPKTWLGKTIFVANTSNDYIGAAVMDTTLISQRIFETKPDTSIFVNYHKVSLNYKGKPFCKFVYHARARGVDLTECEVLEGHALAAGGHYQPAGGVAPFVL